MKLRQFLATTALCLSAFATHASTVFVPTDGNVNFIFPTLLGYDLYIFDDSVDVSSMSTTTGLWVSAPEAIVFDSSVPDASGSNGTLLLSGNTNFILGITDGSSWMTDNGGYINLGADSYLVSFDSGSSIVTVDVAPIPLPAAVWLFGAGLVGLAGIARRRV